MCLRSETKPGIEATLNCPQESDPEKEFFPSDTISFNPSHGSLKRSKSGEHRILSLPEATKAVDVQFPRSGCHRTHQFSRHIIMHGWFVRARGRGPTILFSRLDGVVIPRRIIGNAIRRAGIAYPGPTQSKCLIPRCVDHQRRTLRRRNCLFTEEI